MIHVLDDFHPDPAGLRAAALAARYEEGGGFPGERSLAGEAEAALARSFEPLIGKPILRTAAVFQIQPARFADRSYVHCDASDWAAVLYLNDGHDGEPGTSFYRHRATGLERFSPFEAGAVSPHIADGADLSCWDLTRTVPFRFNRLALYDATQFHRNATAWGSDVSDARLVLSFFLCTSLEDGPAERFAKRIAAAEAAKGQVVRR